MSNVQNIKDGKLLKVTYAELSNDNFRNAVLNLARQPLAGEAKFKVKKIIESLEVAEKNMVTARPEFVKKYTNKDENGMPKLALDTEGKPNGNYEINKELEKEAIAAIDSINNGVYEFEAKPIFEYELLNASVSAFDLKALEPFIVG